MGLLLICARGFMCPATVAGRQRAAPSALGRWLTSPALPHPPACLPACLQVGAQTETELKEKKLRVEDALNATKAAVEEGIVTGGGCTLLRLSHMVDAFKATLTDEEQKVGAQGRVVQEAGRCRRPEIGTVLGPALPAGWLLAASGNRCCRWHRHPLPHTCPDVLPPRPLPFFLVCRWAPTLSSARCPTR